MAEPERDPATGGEEPRPVVAQEPVSSRTDDVAVERETVVEERGAAAEDQDGATTTRRMPATAHPTTPIQRAQAHRAAREADRTEALPPPPAQEQPVLAPAQPEEPPAPKRHGNRLVGTAWVLLAAGLFELLFFALIGALVALLGGPQAVVPQLQQYANSPFAWLPVLFFFLLFELTVLIFNRAGRFFYVVASLIVGLLVYVASTVLVTQILVGAVVDTATLQRAFLNPPFVLVGLAAREVMLWTGFGVGARGTRVRRRDRAARDAYRTELQERRDADA